MIAAEALVAPLRADYVGAGGSDAAHVLGAVYFGEPAPPSPYPSVSVAMKPLYGGHVETWRVPVAPERGSRDGIDAAWTPRVLFGRLEFAPEPFETAVTDAYARILRFVSARGFPHLARVWNYFPDIHARSRGLDRYQRFCAARYEALAAHAPHALAGAGGLPAASVLGTAQGSCVMYFLAVPAPGRAYENPRQISAYRYPPRYAPKRPLFARAYALDLGGGPRLVFISGTASIVGHASRHRGDVIAQTQEILRNLEALLAEPAATLDALDSLKIYLRDPNDLARVRVLLDALLPPHVQRLYLHAHACRPELLVEIEGIARVAG